MADAGDIERFEGVNKATSVDEFELGREIRVECRRAFDCVTDVGPGWAGGDLGGDGHGLAVVGWRDAEKFVCQDGWWEGGHGGIEHGVIGQVVGLDRWDCGE